MDLYKDIHVYTQCGRRGCDNVKISKYRGRKSKQIYTFNVRHENSSCVFIAVLFVGFIHQTPFSFVIEIEVKFLNINGAAVWKCQWRNQLDILFRHQEFGRVN